MQPDTIYIIAAKKNKKFASYKKYIFKILPYSNESVNESKTDRRLRELKKIC